MKRRGSKMGDMMLFWNQRPMHLSFLWKVRIMHVSVSSLAVLFFCVPCTNRISHVIYGLPCKQWCQWHALVESQLHFHLTWELIKHSMLVQTSQGWIWLGFSIPFSFNLMVPSRKSLIIPVFHYDHGPPELEILPLHGDFVEDLIYS